MVAEQEKKSSENRIEVLEQALADSQDRFRNVIERNADGILIVGIEDGIVRYLNPAAEELFGVSAEELEGEIFGFPVVAERKSSIDIVRRDRSDVVAEMHVVETEWDGEPALLASLRDITPRVRILRALEQSEKRYRILFDRAGDAIFVHDLEGNFLDVNRVASQRYGYTVDELLDMTPRDLDTPEHAAKVSYRMQEIKQTGQAVFEAEHRCVDGRIIDVEINAQLIEYNDEPAILSVARDITERKRAEKTLQERLKELTCLYAVGRDMHEDLSVDQLCGRIVEHLIPAMRFPQMTVPVIELSGDRFTTEKFIQGLSHGLHAPICVRGVTYGDLWVYYLEDKPFLIPEEQDLIDNIADALGEWFERTQAEQALKWQQEVDAAVAGLSKNLLESISIEDISYRVLDHAKRLTGSTFGYVGYIDPESGFLVSSTMTRDIWDQCHVPDKDIVFETFSGLWGWVLENCQPLMTNVPNEDPRSTGVPVGHIPIERFLSAPAMIGDELVGQVALANPDSDYAERDLRLTQRLASIYALALQRKRAEDALAAYSHQLEEKVDERTEALRQAQEKALRQERLAALGQLAGGVAHDLRNPLSVISSAIYYLKMVQSDAEDVVLEYLDMIDDEVKTADRIVADLLDFARDKTVVPRVVDLDEIVAHVLDRKPPPQGVGLAIQIPEDLPPAYMDSGHLKQILTNLITNAYQAMDDDGILSLRASTVDGRVQLDVIDTGQGISPEHMKRIFEPLFTTKSRGIGLGLAICQKLIEANQGDISVTSEEGAGSTFRVTMPIYQQEDAAEERSKDD